MIEISNNGDIHSEQYGTKILVTKTHNLMFRDENHTFKNLPKKITTVYKTCKKITGIYVQNNFRSLMHGHDSGQFRWLERGTIS